MVYDSDTYRLWLRYAKLPATGDASAAAHGLGRVTVLGSSEILESAVRELSVALPLLLGRPVPVFRGAEGRPLDTASGSGVGDPSENYEVICAAADDCAPRCVIEAGGYRIDAADLPARGGFLIRSVRGSVRTAVFIAAAGGAGLLYGVFAFLRLLQTGADPYSLDVREEPALAWRMLDHWDNLDGSVERGYAGSSLWKWDELPGTVDERYTDYARACASVGINAAVLNNVNAVPEILTPAYLEKAAAIAGVLRRYAIRVLLSVNFSSCVSLGGLDSADPLDPAVAQWWRRKADEVYRLIPDFGGFVVKADSEGQPGPYRYGRNHADGANVLAAALAGHGGILLWRAFVYGHGETDRAKKAYADFVPLDGTFLPNAAVQVKNGPIDFQPREPVHPLFGGMRKTRVFMEFQITQEYLGQGNHAVFLAPMWKEILDFDTHASGEGSTVGRFLTRDPANTGLTGVAGVANTGDDESWCGSPMHQANWYAFGRLAWDCGLEPQDIAREWIACTFGRDERIVDGILPILMDSWEACIDYMTPLGLHHIMREGHHYGPDPGFDGGPREDWRSTYYHRADEEGLGFDRTRRGSGAVDQYHPPVADRFDDIDTCPEEYLLWFHHADWNRRLASGRSLKDELVFRYDRGVRRAEKLRERWETLRGLVDPVRWEAVARKLDIQAADALEWRDTCVAYFSRFYRESI